MYEHNIGAKFFSWFYIFVNFASRKHTNLPLQCLFYSNANLSKFAKLATHKMRRVDYVRFKTGQLIGIRY